MARKPNNEQAQREAEEARRIAELQQEHAPDGPYPVEGGVFRRKGDALERVEPADEDAAAETEAQE